MNETCKTCMYFRQHYVKADEHGERFAPTPSGHCTQGRHKLRYYDKKACESYQPGKEEPPPSP